MSEQLYFGLGTAEGFTSRRLADKKVGFTNSIRELLQNSLDAAREKDTGDTMSVCKINIRIKTMPLSDVPHINKYEETLDLAVKTMKTLESYNKNNKRIVKAIKDALKQKNIKILMFSDNGIGMNKKRLDALFDERSSKGNESSAGSFGVGHLSSYSLSSLRYVLYATQFKKGAAMKKQFSGSPILAGHHVAGASRGSVGRIVAKKPSNEKLPEYDYPEEIPSFLKEGMPGEGKTGTMVAILGLTEDWGEDAEYAIVSNFFHAINYGLLHVTIHQEGEENKEINEDHNAEELVNERKGNVRATGDSILSGYDVWRAWQATTEGKPVPIKLSNGDKVDVHISTAPDMERSTIALVRNGMLIARHDKMLSAHIEGLRKDISFQPFTAIIDVDIKTAPEFFELVKGAESSSHDELQPGKLSREEQTELRGFFAELSKEIKKHLIPIEREVFFLEALTVPSDKAEAVSSSARTPSGGQKATPSGRKQRPKKADNKREETHTQKKKNPNINLRDLEANPVMRASLSGGHINIRLRIPPTDNPYDKKDNTYLSVCLGQDRDVAGATHLDFAEVKLDGEVIFPKPGAGNFFAEVLVDGKSKCVKVDSVNTVLLGKINPKKGHNITAKVKTDKYAEVFKAMAGSQISLLPVLGLKQEQANAIECSVGDDHLLTEMRLSSLYSEEKEAELSVFSRSEETEESVKIREISVNGEKIADNTATLGKLAPKKQYNIVVKTDKPADSFDLLEIKINSKKGEKTDAE